MKKISFINSVKIKSGYIVSCVAISVLMGFVNAQSFNNMLHDVYPKNELRIVMTTYVGLSVVWTAFALHGLNIGIFGLVKRNIFILPPPGYKYCAHVLMAGLHWLFIAFSSGYIQILISCLLFAEPAKLNLVVLGMSVVLIFLAIISMQIRVRPVDAPFNRLIL